MTRAGEERRVPAGAEGAPVAGAAGAAPVPPAGTAGTAREPESRHGDGPVNTPGNGPGSDGGSGPGRDAGPPRVVWHSLVLRGFGPYREEVRVSFPPGLSHWVAPNETGKSTLVAGLAAILYGLPASSDPTRFGQARFRHWRGAPRFDGELEFTAIDGQRYRLERDFASHRVRLTRLDPAGPVVEWQGTHNPGSTRPAPGYEETIRRLVGVASRSLLMQTFCVEQPLPAPTRDGRDGDRPALSEEVQRLVAGAGGGSPEGAVQALAGRVRELTRRTRDWGISSQNQRIDRELEQVETRIQQLEEAIRRDRQAADDLERVRRRRAELAAERLAVAKELERRERLLQAWQDWRRLAQSYRDRVDRRVQLEQALQRARELERELDDLRRQAAGRWPGWDALPEAGPDEPGAGLDRLVALEEQGRQVRQRQQALRRQGMQSRARALLAAWHRYRWLQGRAQALRRERERYPLLAAAGPEERERIRGAELERARRAYEVEAAERELAAREAAWQAWEEEARALDEAFADVREWTPAVAAAAARKPGLLARIRQREEDLERVEAERRRRVGTARRMAVVVALLAGLAAVALVRAAGGPVPVMVLAGGVAALGGGWLAVRWLAGGTPPAPDAAEAEHLARELQEVDRTLGPWAAEPPERLEERVRRFHTWQARRQALEERRQQLPAPAELEQWRGRVAEARRRQQEFEAWLEPYRQALGDPARALSRWEEIDRLARQVEELLREFCQEEWGASPGEVPGLSLVAAGGDWLEVGRAAAGPGAAEAAATGEEAAAGPGAVPGVESGVTPAAGGDGPGPSTVGELAAWLEQFDPAFWDEPQREAAAWTARLRAWGLDLAGAEPSVPDAGGERQAAAADPAAAASGAGQPWPAPGDASLVRFLGDQRGAADLAAAEARRLEEELSALRREGDLLRRRLAPVLARAGGDPERARAEWQHYRQHRQRQRDRERELAGLLQAWQAPDVDALAARVEEERDGALVIRRDLERLAEQFPGLPGPERAGDPAVAGEALDRLAEEVQRYRERLSAVDDEDRQLGDRERDYTRAEPINIAAAELELAELRQRREALQEEIEALVLAYRELQAAVRDYHATYRERLEDAASRYFARMTARPGRRVTLDQDFRVGVVEPDGTPVPPEQLSQGARDQLYWALRVAIADLVAADARLPFLLDDPFVHWDDGRLAQVREILGELAREGQVVLLSHRRELAAWGKPVTVAYPAGPAAGGGAG
mgnify:CR=1 FL=1